MFISSDRDEAQFAEYFHSMPWLSLPFSERGRKAELSSFFEVDGIPTLIVLDENRKVITTEGRGAVGSDPEGAEFPWKPKAVNALDDAAGSVIDSFPFLVAETDGSPEEIEAARAALAPTADPEFAREKARLKFFVLADPEEMIYEAIRRFAKLGNEKLYIIATENRKKYVAASQAITADNVTAFVNAFLSGSLEGVTLG